MSAALLGKLQTKQIVFVNTSSASGPFVEALSGPGRTIVTATRNGAEQYATLFGGPFVEALTSEAADADKNRRISVLEAFQFAKAEVERAYKREGLLHDRARAARRQRRQGREPGPVARRQKDGKVAAVLSLGVDRRRAALPTDPKLPALYGERREMERRVENLRLLKDSMEPARYTRELETLATDSRGRRVRFEPRGSGEEGRRRSGEESGHESQRAADPIQRRTCEPNGQ